MSNPRELIERLRRKRTGVWFESPHCKIFGKDRSAGLIHPKQNYLQRLIDKVIVEFEERGLPVRIIILKPRQKGSTTHGAAIDYTWLRRKSVSAVVIGGQVSQVDEAWAMIQTYQKNDTCDWGNTGEVNSKSGTWSHGSRLIRETAGDARAGIGGTHQVLHCFEVARWSEGVVNSAEVLTNIMKCVPLLPGTLINLESTAEGATGAFYQHWLSAMDAEDFLDGKELMTGSFVRIFASWFQFSDSALRLTPEQKAAIENTLDEEPWYMGEQELIETYGVRDENGVMHLGEEVTEFDVWEQLAWRRWAIENECSSDIAKFERDYPRSWRKAFQKSGDQRFNATMLERMRKRLRNIRPQHGIIEMSNRRPVFRSTTEGEATVTIFERPIPGCRYIMPIDPMTGETQVGGTDPDYHGAFVLRAGYWDSSGKWVRAATAARVKQCRWDIDQLEKAVYPLGLLYGSAMTCKIAVEMNQDKGITELLKLRGNADLYVREFFNQREARTTNAFGYQTNVKTREKLIEKMAAMIREWDKIGEGIDIFCPIALEQAENFVRKKNGRSEAADGWHDDDVLAIALGCELIGHATTHHPVANIFALPPDIRALRAQEAGRKMGSAYS